MIYNNKLTVSGNRIEVLSYIDDLKSKKSDFTLIDVGAAINPWTIKYVTHVVDIQPTNLNVKNFIGNVSDVAVWNEVLSYVSENGKFDFLVASHLLEDISAAPMVCNMFSKIAKEGFIAVPSKYVEFSKPESSWYGYIHHRWIYDLKNGKFLGYPKQPFLEHVKYIKDWAENNNIAGREELQFFWKDEISLHAVNGDFLGPTLQDVMNYYLELTND